ncbi:MAG: ASCH domain-containing protein [Anaerolineales bacterium]|nr:ASCH domain-containing protein [Anaerolineales bacterium]
MSKSEIQNRALSVRQPFAEMILRGIKKIEYRTMRTNIRGRVYIYASLTPGPIEQFEYIHTKPGDLPTGVLVGTVEIVGCETEDGYDYEWHLANPERLEKPIKADNRAQPSWFIPFKK